MIISFYDNEFKGLQNNASLTISNDTFSLTKRPVEVDTFSCTCEAYTEDIQPTFIIVKDNRGRYVYSCFAGIPYKTADNKTQITGTDLKSLFSSDVVLSVGTYTDVNAYIQYLFNAIKNDVNKGFDIELVFKEYEDESSTIAWGALLSVEEAGIYNVWDELEALLKYYDLYIEPVVDIVSKKVTYTVGRTMKEAVTIRLWLYNVLNVGKWVAPVNEAEGYYNGSATGVKWILLSNGNITTTESNRDIYPVKKVIVESSDSSDDANREALLSLLDSTYQEDILLPAQNIQASFESKYNVYTERGVFYKSLPCGELIFDQNGITSVQLGYRYVGAEFI